MIRFNEIEAGHLVAQTAGTVYVPGHHVAVTRHRDADGALLGGVILSDYTGVAFTLHEAGFVPNWMSRDLLWATFHYAFVQLGCTSMIGTTPSHNTDALNLALRVGFEVETTIKDCLPGGGSLIITRMWRDKCRWLKVKPRSLVCNQTMTEGPDGR
jgi:RimJ/RimL family protein N-acetyltransferase